MCPLQICSDKIVTSNFQRQLGGGRPGTGSATAGFDKHIDFFVHLQPVAVRLGIRRVEAERRCRGSEAL